MQGHNSSHSTLYRTPPHHSQALVSSEVQPELPEVEIETGSENLNPRKDENSISDSGSW